MPRLEPHTTPSLPDLHTLSEERSKEYDAFLKYVAQSTGAINYSQLSILYPAICQAAMEWLLVQKKSVDFGFALLHPRPHRANWQQIMVALFPKLGPTLLGKPRLEKEALLTASGFNTKLLSGETLAVAAERYIAWGIEVEPKRSWWKAMFRFEASKLSALGSTNYAAFTARQITNLRPKLTRVYLSFLKQIAYPCAKISKSRLCGRGFIVPYTPKGRVRAVAASDIPVVAVVPRAPEELPTPSLKEVVLENAGLPPVRSFQPENVDLRFLDGAEGGGQ